MGQLLSDKPNLLSARIRAAWRSLQFTRLAKRRKSELRLLQDSALFDVDWYRSTYPDVDRSGIDPLLHYVRHGWREGRDPGPSFQVSAYLRANPDVARSGIDPLLHYIEFGQAEGREAFGNHQLLSRVPASPLDFQAPNDCASFPIEVPDRVPWSRSYRLDPAGPKALTISGQMVGFFTSAAQKKSIEGAFEFLRRLSGFADSQVKASSITNSTKLLADAWFVNSAQLRTRWRQEKPLVVRAYQHDPRSDGALSLVGESIVWSEIDAVDCQLHNPFFPVLFVFSKPKGALLGIELLAFPSLCRGAPHYVEALQDEIVDPLNRGLFLASRLIEIKDGAADPAVREVEVDIEGADGLGPMFQTDLQIWLQAVVGITVRAGASNGCTKAGRFLKRTIAVEPAKSRSLGGTLTVGPDMLPTVEVLTAPGGAGPATVAEVAVPLAISSEDGTGLFHLVKLPAGVLEVIDTFPAAAPSNWPRLRPGKEFAAPGHLGIGAIRSVRRPHPTDQEIIVPTATEVSKSRPPITWLIDPAGWKDEELQHAIEAIALQVGADADQLALLGGVPSFAKAPFRDRVEESPDLESVAAALRTPLVAFVAPASILHDARTAVLLAAVLEHPRVATASCPAINIERLGRAWRAAVGEPPDAERLWERSYPVAAPVNGVWVARSSDFAKWIGSQADLDADQFHICACLCTVSRIESRSSNQPLIRVPRASQASQLMALLG